VMGITSININVMTIATATVTAVGARRQCPMMQEHCRGSVVTSEPDKWLTRRTVSVGSDHGWSDSGREVGTSGGGSLASNQRATNSYVKLQGDFLHRARFLHQACKISRILVKKSN
jgi:hypothetical protein